MAIGQPPSTPAHPAGRAPQASPADRIDLWRGLALALWGDHLARLLLAAAAVANLVIYGYVGARYASLPPFLPLHYSASGEVDRLGTPPEVFMMPTIGLVVLLANLGGAAMIAGRERFVSYLLIGASAFVQILLLVATHNIVSQA